MSFLILIFTSVAWAMHPFSDNQCLDAEFDMDLKQSIALWGAIERNINLKKKKCKIEVETTKYWLIKKKWTVDVCRDPIHIKTGTDADSVVRFESCGEDSGLDDKGELLKPQYCQLRDELYSAIQNQGLIFAEGEKEYLETEHGKIFCSYELLKKYLNQQMIFNRSKKYDGVVSVSSEEKRELRVDDEEENPVIEKMVEEDQAPESKRPIVREL